MGEVVADRREAAFSGVLGSEIWGQFQRFLGCRILAST